MKLLRFTWHAGRWCTRKGCLLALWSLWLLLVLAAAVQLHVLYSHELSLPDPVRRLIERRLAEQGVRFTFTRGSMDLTGRILLENVALGPSTLPEPLVTARSVYLKLNPVELAFRQLDTRSVGASGVAFRLPAQFSPSGQDETLADHVDIALRPGGQLLRIDHLTGLVGGLPVSASGVLKLPPAPGESYSTAFVERLIASYLKNGRKAPPLIARLAALEAPLLDLEFLPGDSRIATLHATLRADSLSLDSFPRLKGAVTGPLTLDAEIPLGGAAPAWVRGHGHIATLAAPGLGSVSDLRFSLLAPRPRAGAPVDLPRWIDLQFASLHWRDLETGPVGMTLFPGKDGRLDADLSATLAGSPWKITAALDPEKTRGRVELDGRVDGALLGLLGGFVKHDLTGLLEPASPAPLHAAVTFLPGWKLGRAEGRLHSGPVRVGDVRLDETGTEFSYQDGRVRCDDLVLRQGESLAHGLYEMDTATRDFRFLLTGGLRPDGISGWFHDWWTRFWNDFDFTKAVPRADVDVAGRWGDLEATRVFVQAEGDATGLRGQPFDRVSTRLFVRPQWDDILWFKVARQGGEASGSFSRLTDLEKDTWSRMTFDVSSSLSLDTIRGIFGSDTDEFLSPYRFAGAPRLTLSGHVESAASPEGAHQSLDIGLHSVGAASFHGFPVSDLAFTARLRDSELELPALTVGFAGGRALGSARVWGGGKDRRVAFSATLADAGLGAALRAVNRQSGDNADAGEKPLSARLENGRLDLSLNAEGLYDDFYSFKGDGTASITGAELGQINLLGLLSELLDKTILNFSSFSLDKLNAHFSLDGPTLSFDSLKITGPRASIDAKGDYGLQDHRLDFKARVFPFDETRSIVGSTVGLVLSPLSNALEVKLGGTLSKPDWVFLYGPTNLLRSIIGGGNPPAAPHDPSSPAKP